MMLTNNQQSYMHMQTPNIYTHTYTSTIKPTTTKKMTYSKFKKTLHDSEKIHLAKWLQGVVDSWYNPLKTDTVHCAKILCAKQ